MPESAATEEGSRQASALVRNQGHEKGAARIKRPPLKRAYDGDFGRDTPVDGSVIDLDPDKENASAGKVSCYA